MNKTCDLCETRPAVVNVTCADLDGVLLDSKAVCHDCLNPFRKAGLEPGPLDAPKWHGGTS